MRNANLVVTALFTMLAAPSLCAANFEQPTLHRRDANGSAHLYYTAFGADHARDVPLRPIGRVLTNPDPDLKVVNLLLSEYGVVHHPGATTEFAAVVDWSGLGSGPLSIIGPKGRLFALGHVVTDGKSPRLELEFFADESLSQQFDRAVMFGESDPLRLHVLTKIWLERVLGPELAAPLIEIGPTAPPRP